MYLGATDSSPEIIPIPGGVSGDGITTRYWDCCKPSCAWHENINQTIKRPVTSCQIDGVIPINIEKQSGCADTGGESYMCNNQQPWIVNKTLAYGFTAVSFNGGEENTLCCSCLLLKFKGQLAGKSMVVQYTNTGGPLKSNHFDIQMPGGGVGIFPLGCERQWNASEHGWGDQYGGVHTKPECTQLPAPLQSGCRFRFDFMEGVSNPNVSFYQVECPAELIAITGCIL